MSSTTKAKHRALIIGGGIHGLTTALALAREGIAVTVIEKNTDVLDGTSNATHNRAHMGYHYPRSIETAEECLRGLAFFKEHFPETLHYPEESYYLIEENSKTSAADFERFCQRVGIPYEIIKTNPRAWHSAHIECGFRVPEPVFDMPATKRILRHKAEQMGVTLVLGTEVIGFEKADGAYRIIARHQSQTDHYTADILVNATYAYTNNLLKLLGLHDDMTEYELQKTEVVTVHSKERLPALTVMDGKFVSIMPLANTPHTYLVYDVDHSVVSRENGFFLDTTKTHPSNFAKMVEHGKKYFPFMEKLQFVKSNYGFRPIPLQAVGDSRQTRLLAHQRHQDIYTICEGKFISAPLIADELVQLMKKNNTL